jgi:hypothetical protein
MMHDEPTQVDQELRKQENSVEDTKCVSLKFIVGLVVAERRPITG